jgi:hypothetical protein
MPVTPGAEFDGHGAGRCVNEPGSAHHPTVSDGEALVLYLLPEGKIEFTSWDADFLATTVLPPACGRRGTPRGSFGGIGRMIPHSLPVRAYRMAEAFLGLESRGAIEPQWETPVSEPTQGADFPGSSADFTQ